MSMSNKETQVCTLFFNFLVVCGKYGYKNPPDIFPLNSKPFKHRYMMHRFMCWREFVNFGRHAFLIS